MGENETVSLATLPTDLRIAHKFLTHYLAPKVGSFDYISSLELCLLWHLMKERRLKLCYLMMGLMTNITKAKGLPHVMALTPLFEHLIVNLEDEVYVSMEESEKNL